MNVARIKFKNTEKLYDYFIDLDNIKVGDYVMVENQTKPVLVKEIIPYNKDKSLARLKVLRLATSDEIDELLNPKVKVVEVDNTIHPSKIVIETSYFSSDVLESSYKDYMEITYNEIKYERKDFYSNKIIDSWNRILPKNILDELYLEIKEPNKNIINKEKTYSIYVDAYYLTNDAFKEYNGSFKDNYMQKFANIIISNIGDKTYSNLLKPYITPILLTKSNVNIIKPKDIRLFMWATPGAMGIEGEIEILTEDYNLYYTNGIYVENAIYLNDIPFELEGYTLIDLGCGNQVLIRNDIYDEYSFIEDKLKVNSYTKFKDYIKSLIVEEKEDITIKVEKDIKCLSCCYGVIINPYDSFCGQYKLKPKEVLYEGKDCPMYKKSLYVKKGE